MAEINKEDLFSDEAMKAPEKLAKALGLVVESLNAITDAGGKMDTQLKGATSATKITKQTEQLTQQEKELIKVQNQISVALAKNNEEYIAQKRGLDAINKAVKDKIMAGREDQTLTGKLTKGMADLKKELKDAKDAMIMASNAGGSMSKEYQEAAKKAGELQDKVSDAKDEAKVFANDTAFGALGTRMGLLKEKMMQLDFKGVGEQLKGLGKIILANPLLLLAAVVIGIGAALYSMRDSIKPVKVLFEALGGAIDWVVQKLKDFSDSMGLSTFAAEDKMKAVIEANDKELAAITKRYDREIELAAASGEKTVELEKKKWDEVIRLANEGMNELFLNRDSLSEDDKKKEQELIEIKADAIHQKNLLVAKGIKEEKDAKEKAAAEEKKLNEEVAAFVKKTMDNLTSAKALALQKEKDARQKVLDDISKELGVEVKLTTSFGQAVLQARNAINQKIGEGEQQSQQERLDNTLEHLGKVQQHFADFSGAIGNLLAGVSESQFMELEMQRKANKDKLDRDLVAAGDNERAKGEIKKRAAQADAALQAEQLKIRRRMAIYDKATALFQAGINTAIAVTQQIPNPVTMALAAALGALQIAAIAAKPIPKFATGTKSSPAGTALVGELGRELLVGPDGKIGITPDGPSLMNLAKGTQVIPNDETMKMLAMAGLQGQNTISRDYSISNEIKGLKAAISEGNDRIVDAIRSSGGNYEQQGSLLYKVNKMRDGSITRTRKKIMG